MNVVRILNNVLDHSISVNDAVAQINQIKEELSSVDQITQYTANDRFGIIDPQRDELGELMEKVSREVNPEEKEKIQAAVKDLQNFIDPRKRELERYFPENSPLKSGREIPANNLYDLLPKTVQEDIENRAAYKPDKGTSVEDARKAIYEGHAEAIRHLNMRGDQYYDRLENKNYFIENVLKGCPNLETISLDYSIEIVDTILNLKTIPNLKELNVNVSEEDLKGDPKRMVEFLLERTNQTVKERRPDIKINIITP